MSVDVQTLPPAEPADMGRPPFHVWHEEDGQVACEFFRIDAGYLQRFPRRADFEISADGRWVKARPVPGVSSDTLEHLCANQAVPMALSRQGRLVLHGSSVAVPSGGAACAAGFVASSGCGKSTLAAHFAANGHSFLTDDGLLLSCENDTWWAMPSHPTISLWSDSHRAVVPSAVAERATTGDNGKSHVPADPRLPHCLRPQRLSRIYFLGTGAADEVTIQPLHPAQACMELSRNTFVMDIEDQALLASSFAEVSRLAALPMHFALDYPRRHSYLPQVRSAIEAHMATALP